MTLPVVASSTRRQLRQGAAKSKKLIGQLSWSLAGDGTSGSVNDKTSARAGVCKIKNSNRLAELRSR